MFDPPASDWITSWKYNHAGESWDDFLLAVKQRFDPDPYEDYFLQQTSSVDVVSDDDVDISIAWNQQPAALAIGEPKLSEEVDVEEKLVAPDNEEVVIAKDAGTLPLCDEFPCDVCPFETLDGIVDDANVVHALIVFETKDEEFVVPTLYDSWQSTTVGIDKWTSSPDYFLLEEVCNEDVADEAGDNVVKIAVDCEQPMKEIDGVDSFFYIDSSKLFYEWDSLGVTKLRLPNCVVDDGILQGEALHIRRVSNDATSFLDLHGDARTIPPGNSFPSRALTYDLFETEIQPMTIHGGTRDQVEKQRYIWKFYSNPCIRGKTLRGRVTVHVVQIEVGIIVVEFEDGDHHNNYDMILHERAS